MGNLFEIMAAGAATMPAGGVILSLAAFALVFYGFTLINRNVVVGALLYGYVGNGILLYGITWTVHPDVPFQTGVRDLPDMAMMLVVFLALVGTASLVWTLFGVLVDEFGIDDFPALPAEAAAALTDARAQADANSTKLWTTNGPATQSDGQERSRPWTNTAAPYGQPVAKSDVDYFKSLRGIDREGDGERTTLINAGSTSGAYRQVRPLSPH